MIIPPQYRGVMDALLKGLDPRLSEEQRLDHLEQAMAEPDFCLGILAEVMRGYHARAEALAGLAEGTFVDRLRRQAFREVDPDDVLGIAINDARPGEQVQVLVTNEGNARRAAPSNPPEGQRTPRPIAVVAAEAELAHRRRLESEISGTSAPNPVQESPTADFEQNGITVLDPATAAIIANLRAQRAREAAVDQADPDDPSTMRAAIAAAEVADAPRPAPAPAAPRTYQPAPRQAEEGLCGVSTNLGPCVLRPGHPVAPGFPGENGHMSERH